MAIEKKQLLLSAGISDEKKQDEIIELLDKHNISIYSFLSAYIGGYKSLEALKQTIIEKRTIFNIIEDWIYSHIIYYFKCWILFLKSPEYRKNRKTL